jgi:hypothetical protein
MVLLCEAYFYGLPPLPIPLFSPRRKRRARKKSKKSRTDVVGFLSPVRDFKRILSFVAFVVGYPFCVLFNDPGGWPR